MPRGEPDTKMKWKSEMCWNPLCCGGPEPPNRNQSPLWAAIAFLALLLGVLAGSAFGAEPSAVVRISSESGNTASHGTAFFIGNEGYLCTAEHNLGRKNFVHVDGEKIPVEVVRRPSTDDGAAILKCDVSPPASLGVAEVGPLKGDPVYVVGYPSGKRTVYEGKVLGYNIVNPERMTVDFRVWHGASGSPVIDGRSHLCVGTVLQRSFTPDEKPDNPHTSPWSTCVTANDVYHAAKQAGVNVSQTVKGDRLHLDVYVTDNCGSCEQFKQDMQDPGFRRRVEQHWIVEVKHYKDDDNADLINELGLRYAPAFVVRGYPQLHFEGYPDRNQLLGVLPDLYRQAVALRERSEPKRYQRDGAESSDRYGATPLPEQPRRQQSPSRGSAGEPSTTNWSGVDVLVFVPKKVGNELLASLALKIIDDFRALVEQKTHGQAHVTIVSERRNPPAWNNGIGAFRLDPKVGGVVALVAEKDLGLKGFFVGRLEKMIGHFPHLKQLPVQAYFERVHHSLYSTGIAIRDMDPPEEPDSGSRSGGKWRDWTLFGVIGLIVERLLGYLGLGKVYRRIASRFADDDEDDPPPKRKSPTRKRT